MKFENTQVSNFSGAFRGMRNPLASWKKSDSYFGLVSFDSYASIIEDIANKHAQAVMSITVDDTVPTLEDEAEKQADLIYHYGEQLKKNGILQIGETDVQETPFEVALIGPQDMQLAQRLIKAGPEHRKFLRQIFVSVDITAPLYFFKELDTYKVATVANSTSTMHKLASTEITLDCFEIDDFEDNLEYYRGNTTGMLSEIIIEQLEFLRQQYNETKDIRYWKELIRWLPEGWLQTRTWTANYETIRAICSKGQRRYHKLTEWSKSFIEWARTLPYAQYFIFDDEKIAF
jgi:hypothetical protein